MNSLYRIKQLLYRDFKGKETALLIFPIMIVVSFFSFTLDFGIFTMIIGLIIPIVYTQWNFIDNKSKTTHYLLIPATTAEKTISNMIICMIIFPLMAFLICLLTAICIQPMDDSPVINAFNFDTLLWESFSLNIILLLYMLQALFTVFLIKYNNKGINIIMGIAVIYIGVRIIAYITYRLIDMFRFNHLRALMEFEQQFHGTLFQEASYILNITMILLTVLLWITAYYCLREKELE